jgi:hypothetical protein
VLLVRDHPGSEALAEQVAPAAVAAVEALRVDAVQPLHAGGEGIPPRRNDEVVVVPHQAEHAAAPLVARDHVDEELEEGEAIATVAVDRDPARAARRDVEVALVGKVAAEAACHGASVGDDAPHSAPARANRHARVTLSAHWPRLFRRTSGTDPDGGLPSG